ncbi:uncharacterized protein ACOB8E_011610 isoform 2-T2 [Sarcophilus harrisii]
MKETDPGAPEQEALELFQDYITYYRAGGRDGRLWACRQPAVTQKARQLLASGARQPRGLSLYEEAVTGGSSQGLLGQGEDVCPRLVPALEFLELVCVNLFLLPWRREIKSLKPRITKSPLDESVEGIYFVLGKKSIHIEEITDPLKSSKNDIINSLMTIVFLMIVSVLSLIPETKIQIAVAGILGIVATVFTVADAALIYRKLMFNPSGPYEKRRTHEKKRRSRHSRHSHHSYHPRLSQEKDEDL